MPSTSTSSPTRGTKSRCHFAVLDPGNRILPLDLTHSRYLSQDHHVNFSGQLYEVEQYEVDLETDYIDYDDLADWVATFEPDVVVSGSLA